MNTTTFALLLIVVLLVLVLLCLGVCLFIVLLRNPLNSSKEEGTEPVIQRKWCVELWDIGMGCCYMTQFDGGVTLGRGLPGAVNYGRMPIGEDLRISRNQSQIYEQDGCLYLWNLSEVNQTLLNGSILTEPAVLHVGDRLIMGGHTYLLTLIHRAQQPEKLA